MRKSDWRWDVRFEVSILLRFSLLIQIYRHGQRDTEGAKQLTNEGKRELYRSGQYFHRRYSKILEEKYSPDKVYIVSTDKDRTIMRWQQMIWIILIFFDAKNLWFCVYELVRRRAWLVSSFRKVKRCGKRDFFGSRFVLNFSSWQLINPKENVIDILN